MDLLILSAVFFVLSIFFSGMEIAYTSFDNIVLEGWKKAKRIGVHAIDYLTIKSDRFLMTTLIGTNLSNVAYATLIVIWAKSVGIASLWVMIGSPLLVLVFAEVLPKLFGYAYANPLVRIGAYPLLFSHRLFAPLRWLLLPVQHLANRFPSAIQPESHHHAIRRELVHILSEAESEGAVNENEGELLLRYLNSREIRVREVMTPRTKMVGLPKDSAIADAVKVFAQSRHNVLPVYDGDFDHIIGCVRGKDLLRPRASIAEIIRPVSAVPESKRIVDLLERFKLDDLRVAIVIDEHGGTDGIIGLKDIISALVGPVTEAWDTRHHAIKRLAPGKYLVTGSASRDDLEADIGWRLPEGDFSTLSGWITERLNTIPMSGVQLEEAGVIVRVLKSSPRQVEACLISLPKAENGENSAG